MLKMIISPKTAFFFIVIPRIWGKFTKGFLSYLEFLSVGVNLIKIIEDSTTLRCEKPLKAVFFLILVILFCSLSVFEISTSPIACDYQISPRATNISQTLARPGYHIFIGNTLHTLS